MDTRTIHVAYDSLDRPSVITDPLGQSIAVGYDSAGRVASLMTPTGTVSYGYDASSGTLNTVTGPDGGTAFTHDGPLTTSASATGTVSGVVGFTWDSDFRITSETLNGSGAVSFGYDTDSLSRSVGSMTLNRDSQTGLVTGTTLGTVSDTLTYNGFGEPARYEAKKGTATLLSQQFQRDLLGRIIQKTETVGGVTAAYGYQYDAAGRLTDVTLGGAALSHYDYDANGNRTGAQLSTGSVTATYDAQDRLLAYGSLSYAYTANGELQSKNQGSSTVSYTYDVLGNLRTVTLADGTRIDYLVDGLNRRIGKKINGSLVKGYIYRSKLQPVAELDGGGTLVARFVYGTRANVPEYMVKGTTTYRIITDHLGSPRLVVNSSDGSIAQRLDYDEFGNVILDTNPGFQPFGFAGGLYDYQTGLVRFGARDYDPLVGRWTAKDPIGFEGGSANLWQYAGSDPMNFADITGLSHDSLSRTLQQAMARGDAEEIAEILQNAGETLQPGMRKAAEELLQQLRMPAERFIPKFCKGKINKEFPDEMYKKTLEEIFRLARQGKDEAAKTARKLLTDGRFRK